jgi:hypothetical protein
VIKDRKMPITAHVRAVFILTPTLLHLTTAIHAIAKAIDEQIIGVTFTRIPKFSKAKIPTMKYCGRIHSKMDPPLSLHVILE